MTGQTKSTPVINLENTYGVVLSVHGHQLEVKYQKSVEQSGNYSYLHDGRQTIETEVFPQDNIETKQLYLSLRNLDQSQIKMICQICRLTVLDEIPSVHSKNDLIYGVVTEGLRTNKVKELLKEVQEIVSNRNNQNRLDRIERQ